MILTQIGIRERSFLTRMTTFDGIDRWLLLNHERPIDVCWIDL